MIDKQKINASFPGMEAPSMSFEPVRDNRRASLFYYDIALDSARSISEGTALILNIAGNSFYVDQAPTVGNATVHFQDTNLGISSSPVYVVPGFIAKVPFTQLLIENTAQTGKKLRVFYGVDVDFMPGINAHISGLVGVIDQSSSRTLENKSFLGAGFQNAVVGEKAHVQLFNPSSTKLVSVFGLSFSSPTACDVAINTYNTACTTDFNGGACKNVGEAISSARVRTQSNATLLANELMLYYSIAAGVQQTINFKDPIVLGPNEGLLVGTRTTNILLYANFEFTEELS